MHAITKNNFGRIESKICYLKEEKNRLIFRIPERLPDSKKYSEVWKLSRITEVRAIILRRRKTRYHWQTWNLASHRQQHRRTMISRWTTP
jgi:hypothetical protein